MSPEHHILISNKGFPSFFSNTNFGPTLLRMNVAAVVNSLANASKYDLFMVFSFACFYFIFKFLFYLSLA